MKLLMHKQRRAATEEVSRKNYWGLVLLTRNVSLNFDAAPDYEYKKKYVLYQGWTQKVWGGGGGGIVSCIERLTPRGGESMRGVSPLIRGASPGKFLKLDCLRVHFHAIFKSFSLILQADFFF